jgi:hypothetical protein
MLVPYGGAIHAFAGADSEPLVQARGSFWHHNEEYPMFPVGIIDLLPGDVFSATLKPNMQLKFPKVLPKFCEPGTSYTWVNNAQDDPTMVICLKMTPAYGDEESVFSAPFCLRLSEKLRGRQLLAALVYEVRGCGLLLCASRKARLCPCRLV